MKILNWLNSSLVDILIVSWVPIIVLFNPTEDFRVNILLMITFFGYETIIVFLLLLANLLIAFYPSVKHIYKFYFILLFFTFINIISFPHLIKEFPFSNIMYSLCLLI